MVDRSVRVILSSDAQKFISSMASSAESVKKLGAAAVGIRPHFEAVTSAAEKLHSKLIGLGSNAGLANMTRDVAKLGVALRGLSGGTELTRLATGLRGLSTAGPGLTVTVEQIKKLAAAFSRLSVSSGDAAGLREFATALHGLSTLSSNAAADEIAKLSTGIRRLVRDASSVPALRALATALRDLGAAGGALGGLGNVGNSLHGMQSQIDQLQRSLRDLRSAANGAGGGGRGGGGEGGLFSNILGGNLASNAIQNAVYGIGAAFKSTFTQTADYETQLKTFGAVTQANNEQMKQAGALAIQLGGDVTIAGASASDAAQVLTELAKGGLSVQSSFAAAKGTLQLASAATVSVGVAAGIQTSALNMFSLSADQAGKVADILSNTAAASAGEITDYAEGMKYSGVQAHALGLTLTDTSAALGVLGQSGEKGSIAGTNFNDVLLRLNPQTKKTRDAMKELGVVGFDANGQFVGMVPVINQLSAAHKRLSPAAFESATKIAFGVQGMRAAGIFAEKGSKAYTDMYGAIDKGAGVVAFSTAKMSGLGGSLLNVKNQLETAQVTLGEKFSPALQRAMDSVSRAIPVMAGFLAGPAIGGGFSKLATFFQPLIDGAAALITTAWPYIQTFGDDLGKVWSGIVAGVKPVSDAVGGLFSAIASDGTLANIGGALTGFGSGLAAVAGWLKPVGQVIGDVVGWVGKLPAPVKDAALAFGFMKLVVGPMGSIFKTVRQEVVMATYGMGALGFAGRSVGASMALVGTSIKTAFGGWIGLGITAAITALTFFASSSHDATVATQDFSGAIDANTGALEQNGLHVIAEKVKGAEAAYVAAGGALGDYTLAVSGNGEAQKRVMGVLDSLVVKQITGSDDWRRYGAAFGKIGVTAQDVATAFAGGGHAIEMMHGKISDGSKVLSKMGIDSTNLSAGFDRMGGAAKGSGDELKTYRDDLSTFSGQQKSVTDTVAAGAAAQRTLNASMGDGTAVTGALGRAWSSVQHLAVSAMGPMAGVEVRISEIGAAAKLAGDDTSGFYQIVKGANGKPDTVVTPMTQAFADYRQAVTDADSTTQTFITTMDRLAGRNVPLEDTMRNAAAAARGIGSAARKKAADEQAVRDAKTALDTAKAGHVGTQAEANTAQDKATISADALTKAQATLKKMQDSGKTSAADLAAQQAKVDLAQTAATKSADAASTALQNVGQQVKGAGKNAVEVAAKTRAFADAQTAVADSADGIVASYTQYQKTATDAVRAVSEQAFQQHGFAAAVKVGTVEMAKRRAEFIAQQPAAAIASGAADKLANSYGLIPKTVKTLLSGDPMLAKAAAADAKVAYDKATKDRITTLRVRTADAIADAAKYGMELSRMPKSVVTKFNADLATAKAEGLNLYNVYNSTARKWVAQFLTPSAAAAQVTAGNVVRGYDKTSGTWTANLKAIDFASPAAQAAKKHMDDVAQAKYEAKILADTSGAFTKAQELKRAADIAAAARLLVIDGEDKATAYIQAVKASLDSIKDKTVHLTVDANGTPNATVVHADGSFVTKGGGHGIATGGQIHGPGTGTSDSIPVRLSDGEFVVKASATAKHLPLLHAINNTAPGFANGGLVGGQKTTVKMTESGSITGALDAVKKIYSNADKSAAAMNAAAAAMMSIGPSGLLGSQNPGAWGWGVAKDIVPFSFHGIDFPAGVASGTQPIWASFLAQLEPMILGGIRPGEDWGFENRDNVNSPGSKSFHSYGLALDVNAPENGNGSIPGNGPGQVPPAAGALARRFNMLWGGDFTGTKDPMHFELHQRPGGSGGASLAGGVAAGAAPAASSGVDQWVPMMDRVIAGKGLPVAYIEPIMYAQMSHESSGNPAAINNYDINARNGDPSKGLLQFTGATFQRYADPGFNSNIWDPESQMRAFLNYVPAKYGDFSYLTKIGNGAYADGGYVSGPGGPRSDSINARLSNGEFVVNSAATSQHLDLLHAINGYANGGVVGSALALSGRTAATVGPELANVVQALTDIAQAVTDARTAATDKRALENTAWDNLNVVRQTGRDHRGNAQFNLGGAQEAMRADLAKVPTQNKAIYQARAAATASAQDKLNAALAVQATETGKTTARLRVNDQARVVAASRALAVAQARQRSTPAGAAAGRLAADEARIESISRVNAKVAASDALALAKADREWKLSQRTRISYDAAASAAERFQTVQQRNYQAQQSYAAQVDRLSGSLATASSNLSSLQSSRSSMMSGISGTVAGFDSGILGHPDTRNSFATILKGQQYDIAKAQAFNVSIVKLRKLGLSKDTLNTIAAAGVDGGGVTAAALAKATPAQIKQLNATQASLHRIGDNVGATVAGDFYDIGIRAGQGMVNGLESQIKNIEKSMIRYANAATGALSKKLRIHSPSRATHELGVHTATGFTNGVLSGHGAAHSAMAGMVQLPQPFIPAQSYGRGGGGTQRIDVQVFMDGKRIDERVDVKINGFAVDLGHSLEKAGMQA